MNKYFLLGKLQPYRGIKKAVTDNQSTNDIIDELLKTHRQYKSEYDKIAGYFWAGNTKETCRRIFRFLKDNVKYRIEPDSYQTVKSPAAILATSLVGGHNDCKHYSLFFAGILDALTRQGKNINWCYRFANYRPGHRIPHHVFVVVNPQTNNEIWCDAVLNNFDLKKPYINKIDKKMALYSISGIENNESDDFFGQVSIGRKNRAARKAKRSARKAKRKARRSGENCKGRRVAKFAPPLIAARKAFLAIVRLNINKIGTKLVLAFRNQQARVKILEKWCKFGGEASMLKSTVAKVEAKLKRKGKLGEYDCQAVGSVAAILATALPIIKAILPLASMFLKPGSQAAEALEAAEEGLNEVDSSQDQGEEVSGLGQDDYKDLPNVTVSATRIRLKWWHIAASVAGGYVIAKTIK